MATARLVPEKKPDVELTLTHEEATTLMHLVSSVSGDTEVRSHTASILGALSALGFKVPPLESSRFLGSVKAKKL